MEQTSIGKTELIEKLWFRFRADAEWTGHTEDSLTMHVDSDGRVVILSEIGKLTTEQFQPFINEAQSNGYHVTDGSSFFVAFATAS